MFHWNFQVFEDVGVEGCLEFVFRAFQCLIDGSCFNGGVSKLSKGIPRVFQGCFNRLDRSFRVHEESIDFLKVVSRLFEPK